MKDSEEEKVTWIIKWLTTYNEIIIPLAIPMPVFYLVLQYDYRLTGSGALSGKMLVLGLLKMCWWVGFSYF